ncbi:MAG: hypothetical protein IKD66_00150 [Solobacterium sp.]|nr:hypothetical protein [Solobacterium sp.]
MTNVTSKELIQLLKDHPENLKLFRMKAPDEAVRSLVARELTDQKAASLARDVMQDPVIQLYVASDGSIDGRELMDYVRSSEVSTRSGGAGNPGVRSLLNGKLDIKTLLLIVALMKLFNGSNQQSTQGGNLISSLLGSALGASPAGNNGSLGLLGNLFAAGSQTPASTQSSLGLLGTLLSASQQASQPAQSVQQPAQPQSLLGALLSASQQAQPVQQPAAPSGILGQLLSASQQASQTQAQAQVQTQGQQVYTLDGPKPQQFSASQQAQLQSMLNGPDSVHSNGQINVGNLFAIANALMGK